MIRLYKNTDPGHNKWWSVHTYAADGRYWVVTHYGKIGEYGNSHTKALSSEWQQREHANKKIGEKTSGGYRLICPWCKSTNILNNYNAQSCRDCSRRLDDATSPTWFGQTTTTPRAVPVPLNRVAEVIAVAAKQPPAPAPPPPKSAPVAAPVDPKAKCGACDHESSLHVKGGLCAVCRTCLKFIDKRSMPEPVKVDRFQLIELE